MNGSSSVTRSRERSQDAVNELARRGLTVRKEAAGERFEQDVSALGLQIDVSNVAEALDQLDES